MKKLKIKWYIGKGSRKKTIEEFGRYIFFEKGFLVDPDILIESMKDKIDQRVLSDIRRELTSNE